MRSRGLLMLVLAVVAGLMAAVLAARWLQGQSRAQVGTLVVAARPIGAGVAITAEMLQNVDWPVGKEPPGAHPDAAPLVGRVTSSPVLAGEPVLDGRLAPKGAKGGLSSLLAPGMRAMTVRVNDVVGVAGFITPGSHVDVLVSTSGSDGAAQERQISKIVLERMLVLAVAQDVERDPSQPKVANAVTLEVTPEQAETLDLARSVGSLSLVLRNPDESRLAGTAGATKDRLLGLRPAPAPVPVPATAVPAAQPRAAAARPPAPSSVVAITAVPAAPRDCIEIVRGPSKLTECF